MRQLLKTLSLPAAMGAVLVLPFMLLEFVNRGAFHEDYPSGLFGLLWLLAVAFILILVPLIRSGRSAENPARRPLGLLLRIAVMTLIAYAWIGAVLDQMPCFLGVPLCD